LTGKVGALEQTVGPRKTARRIFRKLTTVRTRVVTVVDKQGHTVELIEPANGVSGPGAA